MGGAGSAWIKPKKRTGLRAAALVAVPHPTFLRPGQRYAPLRVGGRSQATARLVRVGQGDERVVAQRENDASSVVRLSAARLLAAGPDGGGRHYRFIGYVAGRRYRTHALVVAFDERWARLVCPEWHPSLAITVSSGALPPAARDVGAWVRCVADLGAEQPAHLHMAVLAPAEPDFDPCRYHPVVMDDAGDGATRPAATEEDGDVVVFASADELVAAREGQEGIYLTGNPPPAAAGARVYVHQDGAIRGWRALAGVRRLPNGVRVELTGAWHPVTTPVVPALPASGVANGAHGRQRWVARSWSRAAELPA